MFKCEECGHLFEEGEEKVYYEPHGEKVDCCPVCGGNYQETHQCKLCGESVCLENEDYCIECKDDVETRFMKLVKKEFNEKEIILLKELCEEWEI